jgi:hypothetical protein
MLVGVAVSCAVGAAPERGGAVVFPLSLCFFLQPTKPTAAATKTRHVRTRNLELNSFSPWDKFVDPVSQAKSPAMCAGG